METKSGELWYLGIASPDNRKRAVRSLISDREGYPATEIPSRPGDSRPVLRR